MAPTTKVIWPSIPAEFLNLGSLKKLPVKKFGRTIREHDMNLYKQKNKLQLAKLPQN